MDMSKIIGLKVVAIKGHNTDRRVKKCIEPSYILFSDGKTYMELEEQDYYSYHDCSFSARNLCVFEDAGMWERIYTEHNRYPDANTDL